MGQLTLQHLQLYSTLVDIASGMFGDGKKKNQPVNINNLPADRAVGTINDFFKMAGGG